MELCVYIEVLTLLQNFCTARSLPVKVQTNGDIDIQINETRHQLDLLSRAREKQVEEASAELQAAVPALLEWYVFKTTWTGLLYLSFKAIPEPNEE